LLESRGVRHGTTAALSNSWIRSTSLAFFCSSLWSIVLAVELPLEILDVGGLLLQLGLERFNFGLGGGGAWAARMAAMASARQFMSTSGRWDVYR
jgi:hypothetical protein